MGAKGITFMVLLVAIWDIDVAECGSNDQVDCTALNLKMSPCLGFITNEGNETKPNGDCCTALKIVLKTNATCLCEGFQQAKDMGLNLNLTRGLSLPSACKVPAPADDCGLSPAAAPTAPPTAPAVSPSPPSGSPPSDGSAPAPSAPPTAGGNDAAAPAPAPTASTPSGASSLTVSVGFLAIYLGLVAFFSF